MRAIRIVSRASKLALIQSNYIRDLLTNISSDLDISIVEISTKGDRDKTDFLYKSNSVGFFTTEVENALLDCKGDIAVHSFKDLPTAIRGGLTVAAIPKREAVADVLVTSKPISSLNDLPPGAAVGTSSLRRIAQINHLRSDLNCLALRGNVETRIQKVTSGQVDAIVIAQAGINRLGLAEKISFILPPDEFLPAPAQGALAVQIRTDDIELAELIAKLDDKNSRITAETERIVLSAMHGGCSIPLGVYAQINNNTITIDAVISDIEGKKYIRDSRQGHIDKAEELARKLAEDLLNKGGKQILDEIRNIDL